MIPSCEGLCKLSEITQVCNSTPSDSIRRFSGGSPIASGRPCSVTSPQWGPIVIVPSLRLLLVLLSMHGLALWALWQTDLWTQLSSIIDGSPVLGWLALKFVSMLAVLLSGLRVWLCHSRRPARQLHFRRDQWLLDGQPRRLLGDSTLWSWLLVLRFRPLTPVGASRRQRLLEWLVAPWRAENIVILSDSLAVDDLRCLRVLLRTYPRVCDV